MARWAPRRRDVVAALADEVLQHYPRGRIAIGIDGPDASGKTTLADDLARELEGRGLVAVRASIDDFHAPAEQRYRRGRYSPEGCYRDTFQYEAFRRELLEPFRRGGGTPFLTEIFNHARDAPVEPRPRTAPDDAFLVVDGVFLHRPELRGAWNHTVWLEADPAVRAERMRERDSIEPGSERARRYTGAQELYEREARPREAASAIVDNTDPAHPRRVFADSC